MDSNKIVEGAAESQPVSAEAWVKPVITSFEPVSAAQGASFRPGDGISNLT